MTIDAPWYHIWTGFAGGLFSFAHCLGMCGAFVVHLSQGQDKSRAILNQLSWLTGKLFSYLFLGALAGFAGGIFSGLLLKLGLFQDLLGYLAGGAFLLAGLSLLGLLPVPGGQGSLWSAVLTAVTRTFFPAASPGGALTLGIVTGFLPCPIVLGFLASALSSASVSTGMLTMGSLALGTSLPLLLLGSVSCLSGLRLRSWAPRAGGLILVLLGVITALRGTPFFHSLLGCPSLPARQQAASDPSQPCCTGKPHGNDRAN